MPDSQVIEMAIRYASKKNKTGLVARLGELALERDDQAKETEMAERSRAMKMAQRRRDIEMGQRGRGGAEVEQETSVDDDEVEEKENSVDEVEKDDVVEVMMRDRSAEQRTPLAAAVRTNGIMESPFRVIWCAPVSLFHVPLAGRQAGRREQEGPGRYRQAR